MNDDGVFDVLAQARSEGAATRDPVGFAVIEAMVRRAADQRGETRVWLLRRVHERLTALQAAGPARPDRGSVEGAGSLAGLTELVQILGPADRGTTRSRHAPLAPPSPLKAVVAFKGTWSRLRAAQRLRQAMAQVPAKPGPLNSSSLVNRMLQAMHQVSPEYLDVFMAHVDTLLWLEQASGGGVPTRPQRKA